MTLPAFRRARRCALASAADMYQRRLLYGYMTKQREQAAQTSEKWAGQINSRFRETTLGTNQDFEGAKNPRAKKNFVFTARQHA